jgi:hypothetical protein
MRRLDKYECRQKSSRYTSKDPLRKYRETGTIAGLGTDGDGAMTPLEYLRCELSRCVDRVGDRSSYSHVKPAT